MHSRMLDLARRGTAACWQEPEPEAANDNADDLDASRGIGLTIVLACIFWTVAVTFVPMIVAEFMGWVAS